MWLLSFLACLVSLLSSVSAEPPVVDEHNCISTVFTTTTFYSIYSSDTTFVHTKTTKEFRPNTEVDVYYTTTRTE